MHADPFHTGIYLQVNFRFHAHLPGHGIYLFQALHEEAVGQVMLQILGT